MADNLFQGLPPPSTLSTEAEKPLVSTKPAPSTAPAPAPVPALKSALKSALKRNKPLESQQEVEAPQKRLRFRTSVDATEKQVIEAMQKIASHIKNPSKFSKASKLAVQLIQAGSVKPGTGNHFFSILEAAMSLPSAPTDRSVRADFHALFSAAQDVSESLTKQQNNQLTTWTIRAVLANDLYTDDSFVFSRTAGKIKEAISSLPSATIEDDEDEAADLAKAENKVEAEENNNLDSSTPSAAPSESIKDASDPFGLDALLPSMPKKDEKAREKVVAFLNRQTDEEESKRFVKSKREALLLCLEIAARRYKTPWAQTVIDILVKHASDNIDRFTRHQRDAIEKLWASIREQQFRRKQGKSVTGKLDMNAFEWLQEKYANEKISIRHAVGGSGQRRAEQWLG
ncbi:hypothetical protein J5N97_028726 [Dioscorea zingiberensis]|uniref:Uncharacterized protein n=1 Tax=Dioscorea zingiberensis TaxID=325984 RepID=A0A9D5H533_9LILI|nr:hypothetical protein J5N97_028726 [Dioscorea zingiberensis]